MNFKFNKLYNTIMEDIKSSKIKAKKVIKEDNDYYDRIDWEEKVCDMIDEEFDKLLETYSPTQQQILRYAYEEWYDVQNDLCVDIRNRLSQEDFKNEEIVRAQIRKHFEEGFKEVLENYRRS